ncbi:TIGR03086 family metal-binding protein [Allokutzneria sp. A3M-2-11 16]|uniref:TIGR03086 family metal-binding protein n=1 Tax=Allokutzneria sp. A3M-2-11 16 TaxID=2962043 RepID=UPI0020B8A4D9|nr:TIGR03086 family metal-binding protein [Allokutzneria sp. A3M-2-11 16]MCP3805133.1 TIGR03086 family metal-binding protein [Allokutzneria sp. A3M-2-11 16]
MDIRELDRRALALTGEIIKHVRSDQLALPTPCPDWTLYGLLRHLVCQNEGFSAAARGQGGPLMTWRRGDLGDDPYGAYTASAEAVTAAFAEDGVLERPFTLPEVREDMTFPGRVAMSFHFVDFVAHAWDVATTIGVAWEPDDEMVAAGLRVAAKVPADDRGPGTGFGQVIGIPEGASPSHRLLALLGRRPA